MSYRCPLVPPHVDAGGAVMEHESRRDCVRMGAANRGTATAPAVVVPLPSAPAEAGPAVPSGVPPSPVPGAPESPAVAVPTPEPAAEPPRKGRRFGILKRRSDAAPESETKADRLAAEPRWMLSGSVTTMFWGTVLSLARGAVEAFDSAIHARQPFDTSILEFTVSEEKLVGEVMPPLTTKLLKGLGVKSEEAAETFVHGMVILRIFGRIALALARHVWSELAARAKEAKEKKAATAVAAATAFPAASAQYTVSLTDASLAGVMG